MDKMYLDLIIGGFLGFMLYFGMWILSKYARVEIEEKKHKPITVEQLERDMKRMEVQKSKIEKIIGKSVK